MDLSKIVTQSVADLEKFQGFHPFETSETS